MAEAAAACLGMVLFALCSHRGLPWIAVGAAGLIVAAFSMQRSCGSFRNALAHFGLSAPPLRVLPISLVGCAIGIGLGIDYRISFGMTAFPISTFEPFALAACCIGAAEELLYRGWMQARLRTLFRPGSLGRAMAILLAAAAHTAYKVALFALPSSPVNIEYRSLAVLTLAFGALAGLLRELSRSVIPAVAGHVAFDLIVYGDAVRAPWWVWA